MDKEYETKLTVTITVRRWLCDEATITRQYAMDYVHLLSLADHIATVLAGDIRRTIEEAPRR